MPAAIAVPAIASVVAAGASAAAGAHSASKAAKAQLTANEQAIAFQREQEAARRAEYDKAMQRYEAQWNAWNSSRNALLQRYGIDIGSAAPAAAGAPEGGAGPAGGGPGMAGPGPQAPGPQMAETAAQGPNLADLVGGRPQGEWSDWSRYGLRPA